MGVAAILLSTSGSVVIMAIGLIAYWLFRRREVRNNALTVLFIIGVVGLVVLFIILNSETAMTIEDLVNNIILGADITDEGNSERFSSMLESLSYIKDAVFGCGWNLVSNLFEAHESTMIASFSDVLEMTLELGIHGIIIYIVSLVALMFKLLRHGSNNSVALCMSLGVIFMLQVGTDYAFDPCIMLVFGLCIIELWERRSQIEAED